MVNAQAKAAVISVEELVTSHINKLKDDNTTRFLFAASRGDTPTMRLMLDKGMDPNSVDYDRRSALMVAAMNGNSEVVTLLLNQNCNPNLADVHGTTALYEAVKGSHDECLEILMKNGAELCMPNAVAASLLCKCVYDSDIKLLSRLCMAGINLDAADYDMRTALHIAASEGNLAAIKVLVEGGADLSVKDRWNHSIEDECKDSKSFKVMDYLDSIKK
jgi:potassium channel